MTPSERVLKVDAKGRVWTPPEQREAALDEFERSGVPASQFAKKIGVKYPTFANWVQQRRRQRGEVFKATKPRALQWVEARVESEVAGVAGVAGVAAPLVVHLPGGIRMEIEDAAQAALAVEILRRLAAGGVSC
jgi:transposase-like protein